MAGVGKLLFPLQAISSLSTILLKRLSTPLSFQALVFKPKISNANTTSKTFQKHSLLPPHHSPQTLVFDLEGALLKTHSIFPYLMLVAFEAGGILRALFLLLFYPLVSSVNKDLGMKIMVFISFAGIRKDRYRVGTSVLPKYFLEDVGCEGFDVVMGYDRKIGVSELPRVMVEGFLKDYLGIDAVVGRELKVVWGFYTGLMEEKDTSWVSMHDLIVGKQIGGSQVIGFGCFNDNKSLLRQLSLHCKEVHRVTKAEKRNWQILPQQKYPKPLIFHDGRLAFRPTPSATLAMFMWLPFGLFLSSIRIISGVFLPFELASPIHALTGARNTVYEPKQSFSSTGHGVKTKGVLYVCNHRTLLDPIYISLAKMKPVTAVTYSMSKFNEVISPIRTVRLTRNRERDRELMEKLLSHGDLVVCPEGTTCREPYLLRFSPLFAEMTKEIVPVALSVEATMFYGSTASGLKCLDPLFHYMNPRPKYSVKILEKLPDSLASQTSGEPKFEVANYVQNIIAKSLGFECTNLTRKDKYMILAGNNGI